MISDIVAWKVHNAVAEAGRLNDQSVAEVIKKT